MRHLIIAYHAVSSNWPSPLAVSHAVLREQLGALKARGYVGFTLSEMERRREAGSLPKHSVAITFDDGYSSTLEARDALRAVGYPATVFPVLSFLKSGEKLQWPGIDSWIGSPHSDELRPLTWDDLELLREEGWEVGSHTVSHPDLTAISSDQLEEELTVSRRELSERLGRCESIAYPYGRANDAVAAATEKAGYEVGVTLSRYHDRDQPYLRPRVGLYPRDHGLRLRAKLSPALDLLRRKRRASTGSGDH